MLAGSEIVQLYNELKSLDPYNVPPPSWMETPTPHKMTVTLLVKGYMDVKHIYKPEICSEYEPQHRKNFCMLLLKLIQYPDMSYADMYQLLRLPCYTIDATHLEHFDKAVASLATQSVEQAFDFVEIYKKEPFWEEDAQMSQYSIVGLYMRRVHAVLQRMNFPAIYEFHQSFCDYYAKGMRTLTIGPSKINAFMYNEEKSCNISSTIDESENDSIMDCDITKDTLPISFANSLKNETTIPLSDKNADDKRTSKEHYITSKWSEKQAELFVQQHCQLLDKNELRALPAPELQRKVCEIIDDTPLFPHVYYLGYMNKLRIGDYFGAVDALHRAFDRSPGNLMRSQDQSGFQYFSLSMAQMQAYFGHNKEALKVLKECVMLAQEDVDQHCLDLAQSWYTLLNNKKLVVSDKYLPDIEDELLVDEFSLAILNILKTGGQWGSDPLGIFDLLAKCEAINRKYSLIQRFIDVLQLRSALWCVYGCADLSALFSQMVMHLEKTWLFGDVSNVDSVCKALSNIARYLHIQGAPQLGKVVVAHARQRFSRFPMSNSWMFSDLMNNTQNAIYRCRWNEAEFFISQLFTFNRSASLLLTLHMAITRRHWALAVKTVTQLEHETDLSLQQTVQLLVLKAFSYHFTYRGFPVFLRASRLAKTGYLLYEYGLTLIHMAQLFLLTQMNEQAYRVCVIGIGHVLQSGGLYERTLAMFVFLRCRFALTKDMSEQIKYMKRVIPIVPTLLKNFRCLQAHAKVLDILSFISNIFNALDDVSNRNKYASLFRQYHREHPVAAAHMCIPI